MEYKSTWTCLYALPLRITDPLWSTLVAGSPRPDLIVQLWVQARAYAPLWQRRAVKDLPQTRQACNRCRSLSQKNGSWLNGRLGRDRINEISYRFSIFRFFEFA